MISGLFCISYTSEQTDGVSDDEIKPPSFLKICFSNIQRQGFIQTAAQGGNGDMFFARGRRNRTAITLDIDGIRHEGQLTNNGDIQGTWGDPWGRGGAFEFKPVQTAPLLGA